MTFVTAYRALRWDAVRMAIPLRHGSAVNVAVALRTFFVSSSIAGKRSLLQSERSARLFINVLYHYREQRKFLLHGFVVMPDHFHVLINVGPDISIERAVQFIKGGFAFRAGREFGFKPPVWQRGFSEVRIYDADAFASVQQYIAQNPVRGGLVRNPEDFPHSSAYPGFELDEPPQGLKPVSISDLVRHA